MSKTVNGTKEQFTWDESGSTPLLLQAGTTDYIYGPGGLTLEQVSSGTPSYFLHDWQGSTLGLASSSGSQVANYTYDAYGNLTSSSGSVSTSLLFQGQYLDSETGLYYLRARYYDPSTGQFLTPDPLNAEVPYAYAGDDPVNLSDPTGEMLTHAQGASGPSAVAPPPAALSEQPAYYHALAKETTPAPAPQAQSAPAPAATPAQAPGAVDALRDVTNDLQAASLLSGTATLGFLATAPASEGATLPFALGADGVAVTTSVGSCVGNISLDAFGYGSGSRTGYSCATAAAAAVTGGASIEFNTALRDASESVEAIHAVGGIVIQGPVVATEVIAWLTEHW
jgi:RHS repeat-associated protein